MTFSSECYDNDHDDCTLEQCECDCHEECGEEEEEEFEDDDFEGEDEDDGTNLWDEDEI